MKREVVLYRAQSEVAGSQTNVVLPSTKIVRSCRDIRSCYDVKDRLRVTNYEHWEVGNDNEIYDRVATFVHVKDRLRVNI